MGFLGEKQASTRCRCGLTRCLKTFGNLGEKRDGGEHANFQFLRVSDAIFLGCYTRCELR